MRFHGGGVGHKSTRQATNFFKKDCHASDLQDSLERRSGLGCGEHESELGNEDFGPEDDGRAVDSDMEELGYADL
jgi:hypothetical protein